MKKTILFSLIFMFLSFQLDAQNQNGSNAPKGMNTHLKQNCRDVSALKRQYLKDSLQLSDNEGKFFWKLFDTFESKEQAIHEGFQNFKKEQNFPLENERVLFKELTDDQKVQFIEQKMIMKSELASVEQRFFQELKMNLSPQTVIRYYQLERSFRRDMVKQSRMETKGEMNLPTKKRR